MFINVVMYFFYPGLRSIINQLANMIISLYS